MNIIFIANNSERARKLALTKIHIVLLISALLLVIVTVALSLNFVSLRYADRIDAPLLRAVLVNPQEERHQKIQTHLQDNLNIMASKLGQMQAQLLRLDALGERLAESSGIKSGDFSFNQMPGQGGARNDLSAEELSFSEFSLKLQELSNMLDERTDKLGALDSLLRHDRITKFVLPSEMPVETDWFSSGYGYRIDPFTGKRAFHEGVDFTAEAGAPIKAAAGGVVIYSDRHPEYGNMVEIDHGDDLVTRYAHASKRLVNLGEVVLQGQKIAEVGNTGRSTGPHLHFEIRHKDKPQNPARFLKKPG
ncbi:MAG: M23 family metallopeptidase [Nitrosomonas sp.]|uniref:M23 family metallopeptidase n=1 Tax=Nitrosomonas sp. TaxID=42353 RepID=UPI001A53AE47|nr:M23 family metallopeptidase [Nitrosomonas sp.]MBL8499808.1 peptidoglycan DD-metalloendopeptidase family protein [Nitrosomonas sp.]UJO99511.1 MAG: M23 family metallopeptidase [Nitrosomonas sp.]UJP03634.1 MAG: M23 family metallopeptidase [Nitrosomonas sp.]UJP08022.1 MAG: M23 family metallopeptidase [Nitrosomonas sp.]